MPAGMPVLRQHHVTEARGKTVDDRNDFVAAGHRERAARTEIVLYVHHDEDVVIGEFRGFAHENSFGAVPTISGGGRLPRQAPPIPDRPRPDMSRPDRAGARARGNVQVPAWRA